MVATSMVAYMLAGVESPNIRAEHWKAIEASANLRPVSGGLQC